MRTSKVTVRGFGVSASDCSLSDGHGVGFSPRSALSVLTNFQSFEYFACKLFFLFGFELYCGTGM